MPKRNIYVVTVYYDKNKEGKYSAKEYHIVAQTFEKATEKARQIIQYNNWINSFRINIIHTEYIDVVYEAKNNL